MQALLNFGLSSKRIYPPLFLHMCSGVYIASLFYSDESRLLVTTDDHIPIVDVADATGTAIGQDFVWLANLACTWENVQAMTDITDACTTSPAIQFRNMLLHAVLDLQNALEVMDLGLLHPVPYKDSQGAIVFVIVQYTKDVSERGRERRREEEGGGGRVDDMLMCRMH